MKWKSKKVIEKELEDLRNVHNTASLLSLINSAPEEILPDIDAVDFFYNIYCTHCGESIDLKGYAFKQAIKFERKEKEGE